MLHESGAAAAGFGAAEVRWPTALSSVSGIPGGIFSPSLAVGAGIGGELGALLPGRPAGAVVLLGMVAYFAGVVQAPITAFVIVIGDDRRPRDGGAADGRRLIATAVSRLIAPRRRLSRLGAGFSAAGIDPIGRSRNQMTGKIDRRLTALGIELPQPSAPGANYVPAVRTGDLIFITGQLSQWNGERRFIGKLGREFSVEEGQQAARLCALNVVALLRAALDDDLDRVIRCVRVAGYVNSVPDFVGQSQVINGASDLFVQIFEEAGRHTRMAVGVSALPYDVAVEVEGVFEIGQG